jgi:FtsZ-interacting cell division protein ZipA
METWVWIVIVAAVAVVVLLAIAWAASRKKRSTHLREGFGPEYDRTVEEAGSRRKAESELSDREKRREELDIRPLASASRDRFAGRWSGVQERFVDDPRQALRDAHVLVVEVMRERGYPTDDFEQRAADVSVDHPRVVENYREGHRLAQSSANGSGSTEDLRQAMRRYRALFDELVEPAADDPAARERQSDQPVEEVDSQPSEERAER